jgi:hypothetical protein
LAASMSRDARCDMSSGFASGDARFTVPERRESGDRAR